MPDPISVCNEAILELGGGMFGAPRLHSFSDGNSLATACGDVYPTCRDTVLELHPWNFATAFAVLVREADTPPMKWAYQYLLPSDPWCIKVRGTDQSPNDYFEIGTDQSGHRVLFSDRQNVKIEYTKRVDDLGSWSPLAIQVLIKLLATKLAKPLTGQSSLTEQKWKEDSLLLIEAKGSDGREGTPFRLRPNTVFTRARFAHGGLSSGSTVVE